MTITIREASIGDLEVLYDICLRTGRAGEDASGVHEDPTLLGSIYVGPYVTLPEGFGFVSIDEAGVGGYILGTADTRSFEAACEERWWPALRAAHRDPGPHPITPDDELRAHMHRPPPAPDAVVARFPAHLHIDLYPRLQGKGAGKQLMTRLLERLATDGAPGVHLGVDPENHRAIGFYAHLGFERLLSSDAVLYLGLELGAQDRLTV